MSGVDCRHCGLPVPAGRVARAPGDAPTFCCSGCSVAYALAFSDPDGRTDRWLARVVLSAFLSMGVMVFSLSLYGVYLDPGAGAGGRGAAAEALTGVFRMGALALCFPILLLIGAPLAVAVRAGRRWLSADALVVSSTAAAFAVSTWNTFAGGGEVYFETAAMVLTLFGLGRWLETRARERAGAALRSTIPERERPVVVVADGRDREVGPGELVPGQVIRVQAGDVFVVDGRVQQGRSFVDRSALTGESEPAVVGPGERVFAGSTLLDGSVLVVAEQVCGTRLRDGVERVLAEALASKPEPVRLADRLAAYLMPLALVTAVAVGAWSWGRHGPEEALLRGLAVVLIACPCALGIATPLAFWSATERIWRRGVLVRGGDVLEGIARTRTMLFDKTGTLTSGQLELVEIELADPGELEAEVLGKVASLERASRHPVARALCQAALESADVGPLSEPGDVHLLPGRGIEGVVDGERWSLTRAAGSGDGELTRVCVERNGEPVAHLGLAGVPRPEAPAVLRELSRRGLKVAVLTGDAKGPSQALGRRLGVPVEFELDPLQKVERVRAAGSGVSFVGDGLNDAAALAASDVGISMAAGSASTLESADVNLLRDGLFELPLLVDVARSAVMTARLNLAWAAGYNAIGMALAAAGRLTPVFAAGAMVLSSAAVVLNTRRLTEERTPVDSSARLLPKAAKPAAGLAGGS